MRVFTLAGKEDFEPILSGRQRRSGCVLLPRHRHKHSYVALVLSGGYEEAGDRARRRVHAGDAIVHGAFEAHLNRYESSGAEVLNLVLPTWLEPESALIRPANPDSVVRLAEKDPLEAINFLFSTAKSVPTRPADWPDELAIAIGQDPHLRLGRWAREHGIADGTISRGFCQVYGISPSNYRLQVRARTAWLRAVAGHEPLSQLATDTGFSDQAHMTRAVALVTGQTPGRWRTQVK